MIANYRPLILGASVLVLLGVAGPRAMESVSDRQMRSDRVSSLQSDLELSKEEDRLTQESKQLAETRYADGCLFVTHEGVFVALAEDVPVVDRKTRTVLPNRSVVCDIYGYTAEMENGVPINFAWTGNFEVINQAKDAANQNRLFAGVYFEELPVDDNH